MLRSEIPSGSRLRVLVAHRVEITRLGIRLGLAEHGIDVCGESGRRDGTAALAARLRPDVCLVDAGLPGGAAETVRGIATRVCGAAVVVLGDVTDTAVFLDMLRAGASGFLSEAVGADALARTVRSAAAGEATVPRALVGALVDAVRDVETARSLFVPGRGRIELSRRQSQVIALAGEGHSTAEIAERLAIDPVTVRQHFASLRRKLGASSRSAALELYAGA